MAAPGSSTAWSGPAPTTCAPTGDGAPTCTTTRPTCSPRTTPASTCRSASGSCTATTARRPATSPTSSPAPTPTGRQPQPSQHDVGGGEQSRARDRPAHTGQRWWRRERAVDECRPVAGRANTYTIVNQHSGECLDVSGASTADSAAVIDRKRNQIWRLQGMS
nr:RICIN domain-containing protein [Streptomyces sp. Z423-1]